MEIIYVRGNVSNISNLLATLPLTIFYDIENIQWRYDFNFIF